MDLQQAQNAVKQAQSALQRAELQLAKAEKQLERKKLVSEYNLRARTMVNAAGLPRAIQWYKCDRKKVYLTEQDAINARAEGLSTYVCTICTGWHNGQGIGGTEPTRRRVIYKMTSYWLSNQLINF